MVLVYQSIALQITWGPEIVNKTLLTAWNSTISYIERRTFLQMIIPHLQVLPLERCYLCVNNKQPWSLTSLLRACLFPFLQKETPLANAAFWAARRGNLALLKLLLNSGRVDVDCRDSVWTDTVSACQNTPLHSASVSTP